MECEEGVDGGIGLGEGKWDWEDCLRVRDTTNRWVRMRGTYCKDAISRWMICRLTRAQVTSLESNVVAWARQSFGDLAMLYAAPAEILFITSPKPKLPVECFIA